jgi:hypothetical protein
MSEGTEAVVLEYKPVTDDRKAVVTELKTKAAAYYDAIVATETYYGQQKDFSIAKTKLQEASMWVTRGLTNPDKSEVS